MHNYISICQESTIPTAKHHSGQRQGAKNTDQSSQDHQAANERQGVVLVARGMGEEEAQGVTSTEADHPQIYKGLRQLEGMRREWWKLAFSHEGSCRFLESRLIGRFGISKFLYKTTCKNHWRNSPAIPSSIKPLAKWMNGTPPIVQVFILASE